MNPEIELHTDFETFSEDHTQCTDHYNRNQWLYEFGDIKVSVIGYLTEKKVNRILHEVDRAVKRKQPIGVFFLRSLKW